MIQNLRDLIGFNVQAQDGEIGKVRDFYFDDQDWIIRYLVADLDPQLGNRGVLLSPAAISQIDLDASTIKVQLSSQKVKDSPNIETEKPVSRQEEELINSYYDWPLYWNPSRSFGLGVGDLSTVPMIEMEADLREQSVDTETTSNEGNDPYLRSISEVIGYHVMALDGAIGKIDDYLVDDEDWRILYLLADVGSWLNGRKVILSPNWVERVSWTQSLVYVDLTQDSIRRSPEYDPNTLLDREYENQLHEYYKRPKYWDKNDTLK